MKVGMIKLFVDLHISGSVLPPIDCIFTWGEWEHCSSVCGKGELIRNPVISTESDYGGKKCPASENKTCIGNTCTLDSLPKDAKIMKLGLKADGDGNWPFDTASMAGLGEKSPYPHAEIATAILPDKSKVYVALDPAKEPPEGIKTLCKHGNAI